MEVVSNSPLPVSSLIWQSRPGSWVLTFVAKATFQLQPGKSPLAASQEPIHEEDSHWDDDPGRSLYASSDLEPAKPRVDVVLVGSAFAPQNQPVRSLFARLIVGDLDKSIEVHQDRTFGADGSLTEGQRFSRMSLSYERASGGPETSNPIGVRLDSRDAYGRVKLPNMQPPGLNITAPGTAIAPIGFGPTPPTWPIRWGKLGRHAASWTPNWLMTGPLPEDLDWSFFNAAPHDQQLQDLPEDARIVLENLHPQIPRLVTNFPALRPRAVLEGRGGQHPLKFRCDTLWIDTDQGIACLTFRGQLALERVEEPGRIVVTLEEAQQAATTSQPGLPAPTQSTTQSTPPSAQRTAPAPEGAAPSRPISRTVIPLGETDDHPSTKITKPPRPAGALPFLPTAGVSPIRDERTYSGGGLPFASTATPPREERTSTPQSGGGLPFVQTGSWPAATTPAPPAVAPAAPGTPPPRQSSAGWPAGGNPPVAAPAAPAVVPPAPVPPAAVRPANPTPSGASSSSGGVDSVWASGMAPRPEVAAGQSIGQMVAAAASSALQGTPADASAGVIGASNAAAGPGASPGVKGGVAPSLPSLSSLSSLNAMGSGIRGSSRIDIRDVLHLVWYHPDSVARICRVPVWRSILDEMEQRKADDDLDDPAPTKDPVEIEDTRDIFEILVRAASQDIDQINDELAAAVRPGQKYVPSLVLLAGELSFPFDERETLKAAVAVATPMVGADEGLKNAVREGKEFLTSPDQLCPGAMIEGYTMRIREAFQRSRRTLGPEALDQQMERALLEGRHYQKRQVLGMTAIRASIHTQSGSSSIRPAPAYIPEDLAKKLPLFQKFRARIICELYLQEDQYENHPAALKVLAIGRLQNPQENRRT